MFTHLTSTVTYCFKSHPGIYITASVGILDERRSCKYPQQRCIVADARSANKVTGGAPVFADSYTVRQFDVAIVFPNNSAITQT
jgi:hypothetical protein